MIKPITPKTRIAQPITVLFALAILASSTASSPSVKEGFGRPQLGHSFARLLIK